jgi:hypothetical protein
MPAAWNTRRQQSKAEEHTANTNILTPWANIHAHGTWQGFEDILSPVVILNLRHPHLFFHVFSNCIRNRGLFYCRILLVWYPPVSINASPGTEQIQIIMTSPWFKIVPWVKRNHLSKDNVEALRPLNCKCNSRPLADQREIQRAACQHLHKRHGGHRLMMSNSTAVRTKELLRWAPPSPNSEGKKKQQINCNIQ